jgi:predicted metalloprotease
MRLDDYDNNIDVEDQRGQGGGFSFGGGGGGGGFPLGLILSLVGSRFGILGILLVVGASFLFGGLPASGGQEPVGGTPAHQTAPAAKRWPRLATSTPSATKAATRCLRSTRRGSRCWPGKHRFRAPKLVFYSSQGSSGCGAAQSAMGPFYCPTDQGIYIDTDFYTELDKKLGAGGDFARVYVMAHEYGHHVQNLVGTSAKVTRPSVPIPMRPMPCRCGWSCRPIAMPAYGPRRTARVSRRAMSRKACAPLTRSAMTR